MSDYTSDDSSEYYSDNIESKNIEQEYESSDSDYEQDYGDYESDTKQESTNIDTLESDQLGGNEKDECFYKYIDNDELINDKKSGGKYKRVPDNERITTKKLTKYERVRILGTRAKQISLGSKVMLEIPSLGNRSAFELAKLEMKHKISPVIIRRYLPDGTYEEWKLNELEMYN